jgi:hypothetical protein
MLCTVHFIITLFNVGNVLLCVIYQLNFPVFMYFTRVSRCIKRSALFAVSCNRGRSQNVLTANTEALLYVYVCVYFMCVCMDVCIYVCMYVGR